MALEQYNTEYLCCGYCRKLNNDNHCPVDISYLVRSFCNFHTFIHIELKKSKLKNFSTGKQHKISKSFKTISDNIACQFNIYRAGKPCASQKYRRGRWRCDPEWLLMETKIMKLPPNIGNIKMTFNYTFGRYHKATSEIFVNSNTKTPKFVCTRLLKTNNLPKNTSKLDISNLIEVEWMNDKEYEERGGYKIGDTVHLRDSRIGNIAYIGPLEHLQKLNNDNTKHYGIELHYGFHFDCGGSIGGKRYFFGRACFVKIDKIEGLYNQNNQ